MGIKTRLISDELFFSIAFFLTAILKPITVMVSYSALLLLFVYLTLFAVVIIRNNFKLFLSGKNGVLAIILIVCILFAFDIIFRKNSTTLSLFNDFLRCGIIPFLFLLYVKDYNKLLYTWAIMAICVGVMYCTEPINGYHLTGNYMQFGYGEMLPAFLGALILIYFFKYKWIFILAVFFFIELCVFANKGAIVTASVSVIVIILLSKRKVEPKIYFAIGVLALFVVIFNRNILELFYGIAKRLDFNSYSLNTISMMINGQSESILNLRFDIWKDVMELLEGHWVDGRGIGYYMSLRQTYPHNVFLDILLHSGVIWMILFCVLFSKTLFEIKRMHSIDKRNFAISMLLLWLIPMNMSLTLWQYTPFWIYFWIVLSRDRNRQIIQ
mgnify:CR=1 FL=1